MGDCLCCGGSQGDARQVELRLDNENAVDALQWESSGPMACQKRRPCDALQRQSQIHCRKPAIGCRRLGRRLECQIHKGFYRGLCGAQRPPALVEILPDLRFKVFRKLRRGPRGELPLDPSEQPAAQFRIVRFGRKPATEFRSLHDVDQRGPQWTYICL